MDPKASLYECEIRVQRSGQNEEIIQDMKNITRNLLLKFLKSVNRKPSKIIMFRLDLLFESFSFTWFRANVKLLPARQEPTYIER
jgi:hypothetical protein